ncbi:MAG: hypothetical protein ACRCYN_06990 [Plesiomonas sp.]
MMFTYHDRLALYGALGFIAVCTLLLQLVENQFQLLSLAALALPIIGVGLEQVRCWNIQ